MNSLASFNISESQTITCSFHFQKHMLNITQIMNTSFNKIWEYINTSNSVKLESIECSVQM